ncbi:MAG: aldo/keto reductase [Thaumarchaeota archaeon]|nr:aldo/keto reductase [Nitrososphaerota archaeon]
MERRELGKTGEKVPVIGIGGWNIGNTRSREEWDKQVASLVRAVELGCNFVDTAEIYGDGKSERLVSEVLKGQRDKIFLATKVSPNHLQYEDVLAACERSLERLGTKFIDLYQIHWPNPGVPIGETMKAMERLVKEGKVRYIGVSNFGVGEMEGAQESLSKSELASNQVEYSLASRLIEDEILPFCEREKLTVIAYSPLARGRIANTIPQTVLSKYQMSPAQLMLNWVTYRESVVAIPKAAKLEHAEENAHSLDRRLSTDDYGLLSKLHA